MSSSGFLASPGIASALRMLLCALGLACFLAPASLVNAQPIPNRNVSAAPTIVKPPSGVLHLYIIGDSTAAKSDNLGTVGWGTPFLSYFDSAKINVVNAATDSGSTRTSLNEAAAEEFVAQLHLDDIVLIQWGHNDMDDFKDSAGRGSLHDLGDETEQVTRDGKTEFVHSFGWYMRDAIGRIRAAGAIPIILTTTVRNRWNARGAVDRSASANVDSVNVAKQVYAPLLDVYTMTADRYDKEGKTVVSAYFNGATDAISRNAKGAQIDAEIMLACIKALLGASFDAHLSEQGKAVRSADTKYVFANILPGAEPNTAKKFDLQPFEYHGNQDFEQDSPKTPKTGKVVLALAGDSTVTYDQGYAAGFKSHLDKQLQVIDLSRGGRTTVSFRNDGRWQQILEMKPDYVMIQFGHNDGARNLPLYTSDLIRFVDEARAAGIKPILVTPISRRYWQEDGKIHSDLLANVEAMKKVAADKNVPLMDLHQRAIEFYEKVGRPATETWGLKKANPNLRTAANPDAIPKTVLDKTHFNPAGSRAIGRVVSDELKRAVPDLAPFIE